MMFNPATPFLNIFQEPFGFMMTLLRKHALKVMHLRNQITAVDVISTELSEVIAVNRVE